MDMNDKRCPACTNNLDASPFAQYCDVHNVCVTCGIHRSKLTDTPWGVRIGAFQCKDCEIRERKQRISERKKKGFDCESTDEVVCPHCGHEHSDSWEMGEGKADCSDCHKEFEIEIYTTTNYTTKKLTRTPNER